MPDENASPSACHRLPIPPRHRRRIKRPALHDPHRVKVQSHMEYTFPFWKQVVLRNILYYPLFCKPEKDTTVLIDLNTTNLADAIVNQNLIVDINLLDDYIKQMLAE